MKTFFHNIKCPMLNKKAKLLPEKRQKCLIYTD